MAKLAINGGKPVRTKEWPIWPTYDQREIEEVIEVIKSRCWCALPYIFNKHGKDFEEESKVRQLERAFAEYHGAKHAIAVNGGSAALLTSYAAAGVSSGDEVIMPPATFISTATAALRLNAIPIFVDITDEHLTLDPDKVEAAITDRTKAIVPVYWGGYPCDMDRIMDIAAQHDLMVVADAAHAHATEWRGKKVGSVAHLNAFSFQQDKNMTCGEGGIIVTDDDELGAKCRQLGQTDGRGPGGFAEMGWNFRLNEFSAAIMLAQFAKLDALIDNREANVAYLSKRFAQIDGIRFPKQDKRMTRLSHLYPKVKYDSQAFDGVSAETFAQALRAEGIRVGAVTRPRVLYQHPLFAEKRFDPGIGKLYGKELDYTKFHCPVCEGYGGKWLQLDERVLMGNQEDMEDFARAVEKIKDNLGELRQVRT